MPHRLPDPTPAVGLLGLLGTLTLGEWHTVVGIAVGLASLVYVVAKTALLFRRKPKRPDHFPPP